MAAAEGRTGIRGPGRAWRASTGNPDPVGLGWCSNPGVPPPLHRTHGPTSRLPTHVPSAQPTTQKLLYGMSVFLRGGVVHNHGTAHIAFNATNPPHGHARVAVGAVTDMNGDRRTRQSAVWSTDCGLRGHVSVTEAFRLSWRWSSGSVNSGWRGSGRRRLLGPGHARVIIDLLRILARRDLSLLCAGHRPRFLFFPNLHRPCGREASTHAQLDAGKVSSLMVHYHWRSDFASAPCRLSKTCWLVQAGERAGCSVQGPGLGSPIVFLEPPHGPLGACGRPP